MGSVKDAACEGQGTWAVPMFLYVMRMGALRDGDRGSGAGLRRAGAANSCGTKSFARGRNSTNRATSTQQNKEKPLLPTVKSDLTLALADASIWRSDLQSALDAA
jgi:hypothetical protein